MEYLPLFIRLKGSPVLLVGGGQVASRKAALLLRAGAHLRVVAPDIASELAKEVESHQGQLLQRPFEDADIQGVQMVIAATPNDELNAHISKLAQVSDVPVNVVDSPALCTFIFPAIVDRDPLIVAIGSGGNSPVLVRRIRSQIEAMLPAAMGKLAQFAGSLRGRVAEALPEFRLRRRFWEELLDRPALQQKIYRGDNDSALSEFEAALTAAKKEEYQGEVYLLGAGPGDPDLVSFKTARLLQAADVVLYDRLVSPQVLDLARRDAEKIYVGKRRADHAVAQQDINQMLVDLALAGNRVARLKGGDPFIFGRGGEEIELLAENRIHFQVVPGVTAASGCACYAGIPLTHRDYAQSVRFITGHRQDGSLSLPWSEFCNTQETLVFYMGLAGIEEICEKLQAHGREPDTPLALVEQGTTSNQRTHVTTLSDLPEMLRTREIHAPTVAIVGGVVNLHKRLQWFAESADALRWPPA